MGKILEVLVLEYEFGRTRTRTRRVGTRTRTRTRDFGTRTRTRTRDFGTRTRTRTRRVRYSYTYSSIKDSMHIYFLRRLVFSS